MKLKKTLAVLIMVAIFMPLLSTGIYASERFTAADALTVLQASAGLVELTAEQRTRYGISGDRATAADALRVLRISAGISTDTPPRTASNSRGNTSGNIINGGIAAIQGDWIYYRNESDGGKLYRINVNNTGREKISDDSIFYINVVGDWVYYNGDGDDGIGLHRVRTNGTGRTVLNNENSHFVHVIGEWIYYKNADTNTAYRMRTDGTSKTKLFDDCESFSIDNNWIYYSLNDSVNFYKMRTNGTDNKVWWEQDSVFFSIFQYVENGICYDSFIGLNIRNAETQNIILSINGIDRFISRGNYIYFTTRRADIGFYRINIDGLEGLISISPDEMDKMTKLSDDAAAYCINIVGNWIYFINGDDNKYYRMRLDGSQRQEVN
jgi:hypothetical protein